MAANVDTFKGTMTEALVAVINADTQVTITNAD